MRRLLTTLVILTGLFCSAGAVWADAQSANDKGNEAYDAADYALAVSLYRKAAEQGYAAAQKNLGWMYDKGKGVTQDYAEAVKLYRTAAEQGIAVAQHNLGLMLADGSGVLQDLGGAHMWLNIAAANGFSGAIGERDALANKLSGEQLEKANKRAKRCMDADYKDCDAEAKSWWQKLKD